MAFDNFGITTNGYTMIAKATTGLLMTFQDGRASSNTIAQADIASATTSDFSTLTNGVLKALSVTGSAVQAIIEFSNAGLQNTVTLKSFCIRAHSAESSSTNYVFAVCSLNDGGITVQPQSVTGVEVRFQVPFDLTFDGAASYIEGIPVGNNASVDMLDRFVSLHSLGNPSAGDTQTILGEKRFGNLAQFYCGCSVYGDVLISQGVLRATGGANVASFTASNLATFNGMAVFNSGVKLPVTDLDTSVTIPVGAIVCLTGLGSNLGVGYIVSGVYSLGSLTGDIDPQGHQTIASQEYRLLTSTAANTGYALAIRIA